MKYEEFKLLEQAELKKRFLKEDEEQQKAKLQAEQEPELEYSQETAKPRGWSVPEKQVPKQIGITTEDLLERELQEEYSEHQKKVLRQALIKRVPLRELLDYYYPDVPVEEMKQAWKV